MTNNNSSRDEKQLKIISKAYDRTVDNYNDGIEDEDLLPEEFINSERYKRFKKNLEDCSCGSEDPKIFEFLAPGTGMRFLDVGSCANLICKKLHEWPSEYYGIDISPKLIKASQNFVKRNKIKIGGLYVAEVAQMPFENDFFDICAVIGVLEYFDIEYIKKALKELHRVLKPQSRVVVDMPNFDHPERSTMIELEGYLGRTRKDVPNNDEFEAELNILFSVEKIDSQIMTSYFARANK